MRVDHSGTVLLVRSKMNTLYNLVLRKMGYKNPCIMYGVRDAVSVSL